MKEKLITVIIPVFNKEEYIDESINSVLNQSYKNYELIIIDDGSTDSSYQILKKYKKNPQIKIIKNENMGVSYSRNLGIKLAKGEYISFLDADDVWDKNFLGKSIQSIGAGNVCYSGHYYKKENKLIKGNIDFSTGDIILKYLQRKNTPNTNSWLLKKDFITRNNILFDIDLDYGEDMLFFGKILLNELNVKTTNLYLTTYNIMVNKSLSVNSIQNIEKDFLWLLRLEREISSSILSLDEKRKIRNAIDHYRKPAAIIYGIWNNLDEINVKQCKGLLNKYKENLRFKTFYNGFKTLKLQLLLIIIKFKILMKSLKEKLQ